MSEYQYYDFRAIDRALTKAEMAELRSVSTRAVITSTSFTNHYEWGDLKADPLKLLEKYFDTFLYVRTGERVSCVSAFRWNWPITKCSEPYSQAKLRKCENLETVRSLHLKINSRMMTGTTGQDGWAR